MRRGPLNVAFSYNLGGKGVIGASWEEVTQQKAKQRGLGSGWLAGPLLLARI